MANLVPGRIESQCRYRWAQNQAKQGTKLPWSSTEDEQLRDIMANAPDLSWAAVALQMRERGSLSRTGKQCRERWLNHLNPEINK